MVDLDTRLLRAFVAVAEELNFTRAAERLFARPAGAVGAGPAARAPARRDALRADDAQRGPDRGGRAAPAAGRAILDALDAGLADLDAARRPAARRCGSGCRRRRWCRSPARRCGVSPSSIPRWSWSSRTTASTSRRPGCARGRSDVAFVRPPFVDDGHLDGHAPHRGAATPCCRSTIRWPRARRSVPRTSSTSPGSGSRAPIRGRARSGRWRSSAATAAAHRHPDQLVRGGVRRGRGRPRDHLPGGVRGAGGRRRLPAAAIRAAARGAADPGRGGVAHGRRDASWRGPSSAPRSRSARRAD